MLICILSLYPKSAKLSCFGSTHTAEKNCNLVSNKSLARLVLKRRVILVFQSRLQELPRNTFSMKRSWSCPVAMKGNENLNY